MKPPLVPLVSMFVLVAATLSGCSSSATSESDTCTPKQVQSLLAAPGTFSTKPLSKPAKPISSLQGQTGLQCTASLSLTGKTMQVAIFSIKFDSLVSITTATLGSKFIEPRVQEDKQVSVWDSTDDRTLHVGVYGGAKRASLLAIFHST